MKDDTIENQVVPKSQSTKLDRPRLLTYALGVCVIIALSFGGGWLGAKSYTHGNATGIVKQQTILTDKANLVSSIAQTVGASVVSVDVTTQSQTIDPYAALFGGISSQTERSAGTGIIISSGGLIVTNRHVVPDGTTAVSITLSDGTVLDNVSVVGRTSAGNSLDIAFLKINDAKGHQLTPATLGDSSKMQVGDTVVAIGNALGQFQNTVTTGIISGYGRSVQASNSIGSSSENLDDMFQTDAAINEGNSGGPLVNINGEVIAINTAIASDSQNIGFAIPINDVKGLIDSVKSTGRLEQPYLGIRYVMLTDDIAKQYKLDTNRGAYIPSSNDTGNASIISGGPAEKAGLQEGDIITKVNSTSVNEKTSLLSILGQYKVGDTVQLAILRGSATKTINVTLGSAPNS